MPPPFHDDTGVPRRIRSRTGSRATSIRSRPNTWSCSRPSTTRCGAIRRWSRCTTAAARSRAIDWWAAEAARRGYIVIAPEYNLPGKAPDYRYTPASTPPSSWPCATPASGTRSTATASSSAASLIGGHMAWDFGLAHPDLFAGVAVVSGLPAKYVYRYKTHVEHVPLYVAIGDLAPATNEVVFGGLRQAADRQGQGRDLRRVLPPRPGRPPRGGPAIFDWMDKRRRDPYPKEFEVVTARPSDNRFYGVVDPGVRARPDDRARGRRDPFGKNLNPATIKYPVEQPEQPAQRQGRRHQAAGRLGQPEADRLQEEDRSADQRQDLVQGLAKPDLEPLLEDLRLRGDRQQIYWMKVSAG